MNGTASGSTQAGGNSHSAAAFFDLSPLLHPLWWLALVVLLVTPDGQRCHCARQWDPRVCSPLAPPSPTCPIACIPTVIPDGGIVVGPAGGGNIDGGNADGRLDVRSEADALGANPGDTVSAPDGSDGRP